MPNAEALSQVVARLQTASWPIEQQEGSILLHDPWGNKLLLTTHDIASVETVQAVIQV